MWIKLLTLTLLLILTNLAACQSATPFPTQGAATRPAVADAPSSAAPATPFSTVRPAATPAPVVIVTRAAPPVPTLAPPTAVAAGTPSGVVYAAPTLPAGWQTQTVTLAPGLAYTISAPPGWRIEIPATPRQGAAAPTMLFSYPANAAGPGGAPVAADQTRIDIVPLSGQEGKSLTEIVTSTIGGAGTAVTRIEAVHVNGIPASRVEANTPLGPTVSVFLLLDRQPLVIQGYGALDPFNAILSTIRRAA